MANISKLNSDQISEMRRLFEEGASQKSLAERYGVSISTVANKLKTKDVVKPMTAAEVHTELGITPEEVAEAHRALDVKTTTVPGPTQDQMNYVRELQEHQAELKKKEKPEKPKRRIVGINV